MTLNRPGRRVLSDAILQPFVSYDAFMSATIPADQTKALFYTGGRSFAVTRDSSGPIQQGNGQRWRPDGMTTVCHFGAAPSASANTNNSAFADALAYGGNVVVPRLGVYELSAPLIITGINTRLVGEGPMGSTLSFLDTFDGSAVRFEPSSPLALSQYRGSNGIENIRLVGNGSDRLGRYALDLLQQEDFIINNVRWAGFSFGWRVRACQAVKASKIIGRGSGRSASAAALSGSTHFYIGEAAASNGTQRCWLVHVSNFTFSAANNIGTCMHLAQTDGLQLVNGYCAQAKGSMLRLDPSAGHAIVATQFANVYFDGVAGVGETPTGIFIPGNTAASSISADFANCFFGNYDGQCINADTNNRIRHLSFTNCNFSRGGDRIGIIRGNTSDIGSRIIFSGCVFRTTPLGLRIIGGRTVQVDGVFTDIQDAEAPLHLSGSIGNKKISASFVENTNNFYIDTSTTSVATQYEWLQEGSFTPTLRIGSTNVSSANHSLREGQFTRIGNRIIFEVRLSITSKQSLTGDVEVSGLPFARGGDVLPAMSVVQSSNSSMSGGVELAGADIISGATRIRLRKRGSNGMVLLTAGDITNSFEVSISGSYKI